MTTRTTLIVLNTESALLQYHVRTKIVHHEFHRFVYGDDLRTVLLKGLETLEKHGACKWLSDDRRNGPIRPADGEWAYSHWFPKARAAGWKYWAVIMPEKFWGQINMKRWMAEFSQYGIDAQAFSDPAKGMAWLESL